MKARGMKEGAAMRVVRIGLAGLLLALVGFPLLGIGAVFNLASGAVAALAFWIVGDAHG